MHEEFKRVLEIYIFRHGQLDNVMIHKAVGGLYDERKQTYEGQCKEVSILMNKTISQTYKTLTNYLPIRVGYGPPAHGSECHNQLLYGGYELARPDFRKH